MHWLKRKNNKSTHFVHDKFLKESAVILESHVPIDDSVYWAPGIGLVGEALIRQELLAQTPHSRSIQHRSGWSVSSYMGKHNSHSIALHYTDCSLYWLFM